MRAMDVIATVLLVVGGLNWGMVGTANFDLVAALFGSGSVLAKAVYTLVGVAAVYRAVTLRDSLQRWKTQAATA